MIKPKKADIQTWIKALRSGDYKQDYGQLQTDDGFCCLGVACKLFIPVKLQRLHSTGRLLGVVPAQQNGSVWLTFINERVGLETGKSLAVMNDNLELTFDEIADVLQILFIEGGL